MKSTQSGQTDGNAAANGVLYRHLQRSESRRLGLILGVVALLVAVAVFRHQANGIVMQGATFFWRLSLLAGVAVYAVALMFWIRGANRRGELMPGWFWAVTTVVESVVPTAALAIVQWSDRVAAIDALTAPVILLYGIFILLTVLRMRPWLCVVSGLICAAGFTVLAVSHTHTAHIALSAGNWPLYASYPLLLLITGIAAALVSFEVRKYFRASLQEAATRHRLDLLRKEVDIARAIQQQLMPEGSPAVPGFDIAGWSRPASETAGDYYDWQLLADGRIAVAIADVSGHGIGPALLMAVCRAYARAIVPGGSTLQSALKQINELVSKDVREGRFVTFAVVIVDPKTGACELLSAGHAPIFLYRAKDQSIDELRGQGIPLGIDALHEYEPARPLQLEPGDALVMVTDGFYEQKRKGDREELGRPRLRDCIREHGGSSAKTIIERLDAQTLAFAGDEPQSDDMTAVVIRREKA